jgi:hypothetical protein
MQVPRPEPGLVISYSYLWHRENRGGGAEGRKNRPAVILLAVENDKGRTSVIVLPVTHVPPARVEDAVEIPAAVKRRLGLDNERSWIVVSEGNRFIWPGYDLRRRADGSYAYGFIPPSLFAKVRDAFVAFHRRRGAPLASRD